MSKPHLLVVGAFPSPDSLVVGGIVTSCRILLEAGLSDYFQLTLIDSTQKTNPPPSLTVRLLASIPRFFSYIIALLNARQSAVLIFVSPGASIIEKGSMTWIARLVRIPVFLFPRGGSIINEVVDFKFSRFWIVPLMQGATGFLCQGPNWKDFAIRYLGYCDDACHIVYNWTATPELLRIGASRRLATNKRQLSILFLGWLEQDKGILELLQACHILSKVYSFRLFVVGLGHAESQARAFVTQNRMDNFVFFEGWAGPQQRMYYLASSDIMVLPSWNEGFPNSIIEGMAAKLAIVVTRVGTIPTLLDHREQAMLIPPRDVEALIVALRELLEDSLLLSGIAEKGYCYARANFSSERGLKQLVDIIYSSIRFPVKLS